MTKVKYVKLEGAKAISNQLLSWLLHYLVESRQYTSEKSQDHISYLEESFKTLPTIEIEGSE